MKRTAPTLTDEQHVVAKRLLDYVRAEIEKLSQGDEDAAFRIRRFIHARLQLDRRPPRGLQKRKFGQRLRNCQDFLCIASAQATTPSRIPSSFTENAMDESTAEDPGRTERHNGSGRAGELREARGRDP